MASENDCIVRLRGLPWSVSNEEIVNFLEGCSVVDVHFTYVRDGRPSGEAYVELASNSDVAAALGKNQQHMGKRYIEVFKAKRSEMEWVLEHSGQDQSVGNEDAVIRLRGIPFECTREMIIQFFSGLPITPNGISLLTDAMGKATGDAYVQFATQAVADKALQKHKEKIGRRYVEIFKSTLAEARSAIAAAHRAAQSTGFNTRSSPYDRRDAMMGRGGYGRGGAGRGNVKGIMAHQDPGFNDYSLDYDEEGDCMGLGYGGLSGGQSRGGFGARGGMGRGRGVGLGMGRGGRGRGAGSGAGRLGETEESYESQTGHSVHMRGLPYSATEDDVAEFFAPLNPVNIVIGYNAEGRPSGEADVDFATHMEADQAMKKNKASMQHRYIELFLQSTFSLKPASGVAGFQGGNYADNSFADYGNNWSEF